MTQSFPLERPEDVDEVTMALRTASALWSSGDHADAVRWLRRAASEAGARGEDARALELARQAAELDDEVATDPVGEAAPFELRAPKLPTPPKAPESVTALRKRSSHPPPRPSESALAPESEGERESGERPAFSTRASRKSSPPLPQSIASQLPPRPAPRSPSSPPSSPSSSPPLRAGKVLSMKPAFTTPRPSKPESSPRIKAAQKRSGQKGASVRPPRADDGRTTRKSDGPPSTQGGGADDSGLDVAARTAVRVSVRRMGGRSNQFVATLLSEGDRAPRGAVEALLVPIAPGDDLLSS